jgi:hypothetical protein
MKRRKFVAAVGASVICSTAGCGESESPPVSDTPTATQVATRTVSQTPSPSPTESPTPEPTATESPEPTATDSPEPTATERNLTEEDIELLLEAFEVEAYLRGFDVESVNRSSGFVSVVYTASQSDQGSLLSDRVRLSQIFYEEVMQQGHIPDTFQIVRDSNNDFVDIDTEWISQLEGGEITPGQFLSNIQYGSATSRTRQRYLQNSFRLGLLREGFEIGDISREGTSLGLSYSSGSTRREIIEESVSISAVYYVELISPRASVETLNVEPSTASDYSLQADWVTSWAQGRITDAGLVARAGL